MSEDGPTEDDLLDFIFNPTTGGQLSDKGSRFNDSEEETPSWHKEYSVDLRENVRAEEILAVKAAENGRLDDAINSLTNLLGRTPHNPALLNNRAQCFRLKGDVDSAHVDIGESVKYCAGDRLVTRQLYTQLGMIEELRGREEEARRDYEIASANGSQFARKQCVKLNPYARLCNQMLEEAMKQLNYS